MDYQAIIAGTVGMENTFGTIVGQVKSGAMSFARFSTDDTAGCVRGYVGGGKFTDDPLETFGGAGVVEIPSDAKAPALHLRKWLRTSRRGKLLFRCTRGARGCCPLPRLADLPARELILRSATSYGHRSGRRFRNS